MHKSVRARTFRRALLSLLVLAALLAAGRPAQAARIVYVVPGGAGLRDGTSWANAKDLAVALAGAAVATQVRSTPRHEAEPLSR